MKNKNKTVQAVEETLIVILLAAVVILAMKLWKLQARLTELTANQTTVEENVPQPQPQPDPVLEPPKEPDLPKEEDTAENVSGNDTATASGNDMRAAVRWIENYPRTTLEMPLSERVKTHSSYDDTLALNAADKAVIENAAIDFSGVKIACLGDSLTWPENVEESQTYPEVLKEILGAEEVYNLGIGGSTVMRGDRGANPMVDRFGKIPSDTDILIVFASTNDCLFENQWEFGHIEYEKRMTEGTFCGDLDEMLGGIKYSYVDHSDRYVKLLFVAPPATMLNTEARKSDPGIMEQSAFIDAIMEIAPPYGFDVIDMYNANFLNSHDAKVKEEYVTDGVHPNAAGHRMIAQRLASEIIKRCEG